MDPWTIVAWMVVAHVLGSAFALALVSINRGESSRAAPRDEAPEPAEPSGEGPAGPRR